MDDSDASSRNPEVRIISERAVSSREMAGRNTRSVLRSLWKEMRRVAGNKAERGPSVQWKKTELNGLAGVQSECGHEQLGYFTEIPEV